MDSIVCFANTYSLDSVIHLSNNRGHIFGVKGLNVKVINNARHFTLNHKTDTNEVVKMEIKMICPSFSKSRECNELDSSSKVCCPHKL